MEHDKCQQQIKSAMLLSGGVSKISEDEIFFIYVWMILIDHCWTLLCFFTSLLNWGEPKLWQIVPSITHWHCIKDNYKFPWYSGLDFPMFQFSLFVVRVHYCPIFNLAFLKTPTYFPPGSGLTHVIFLPQVQNLLLHMLSFMGFQLVQASSLLISLDWSSVFGTSATPHC